MTSESPLEGNDIDSRFFSAAITDDTVRTRGIPACSFGHRIRRGPNQPDAGVFAEWRWDGEALTVDNDRYGMWPLYLCATRDAIRISPSIVTLIREGAPTEFDWEALAVFWRLGFFLDDDTPFAGIKALPPAARLRWCRGELSLRDGKFVRQAEVVRRETAISGFMDLFHGAIRRCQPLDGEVVLPLSGGRDSRHILLELCAQGRAPERCITAKHYPPFTNEDARVAALLASALKIPHVVVEQLDKFDAEQRKNLRTSFCAAEHGWTVTLADCLDRTGATLFDGIGGDVLSAGLFLSPERQALYDAGCYLDLAESILPRSTELTWRVFVRREIRQRTHRRRAVERLAAALAVHRDAANPIGSFYFWNRTRRAIGLAPYAVLRTGGSVFAPYLDHDLFDFLSALPVRLLIDGQLHTDTIRRAYPEYADIPFQDKTLPRPDNRALQRDFTGRLLDFSRRTTARTSALANQLSSRLAAVSSDDRGRIRPEWVLHLLQLEQCGSSARSQSPTST